MLKGKFATIRTVQAFDLRSLHHWMSQHPRSSFLLNLQDELELPSLENLDAQYQQIRRARLRFQTLVIQNQNASVLGFVKLKCINWLDRNVEISFLVDGMESWRQELEEAGYLMLDYLFYHRNLIRVYVKALESEREYVRYLHQLGFKLEGILREQLVINGEFHNLMVFGMLQDGFTPMNQITVV